MKRYMVIKGRKGQLVGSPYSASRFLGQAPKSWPDGEMPKRKADRYQPVMQVVPWHPDMLKPVRKGSLIEICTVMAETPDKALKTARQAHPEAFVEQDTLEATAQAKAKADAAAAAQAKAKAVADAAAQAQAKADSESKAKADADAEIATAVAEAEETQRQARELDNETEDIG